MIADYAWNCYVQYTMPHDSVGQCRVIRIKGTYNDGGRYLIEDNNHTFDVRGNLKSRSRNGEMFKKLISRQLCGHRSAR